MDLGRFDSLMSDNEDDADADGREEYSIYGADGGRMFRPVDNMNSSSGGGSPVGPEQIELPSDGDGEEKRSQRLLGLYSSTALGSNGPSPVEGKQQLPAGRPSQSSLSSSIRQQQLPYPTPSGTTHAGLTEYSGGTANVTLKPLQGSRRSRPSASGTIGGAEESELVDSTESTVLSARARRLSLIEAAQPEGYGNVRSSASNGNDNSAQTGKGLSGGGKRLPRMHSSRYGSGLYDLLSTSKRKRKGSNPLNNGANTEGDSDDPGPKTRETGSLRLHPNRFHIGRVVSHNPSTGTGPAPAHPASENHSQQRVVTSVRDGAIRGETGTASTSNRVGVGHGVVVPEEPSSAEMGQGVDTGIALVGSVEGGSDDASPGSSSSLASSLSYGYRAIRLSLTRRRSTVVR